MLLSWSLILLSSRLLLVGASVQIMPNIKFDPDNVVREKWNLSEQNLITMMGNFVNGAMEKVVDSDLELSEECSMTILDVLFGIRDMKLWAFQILDAIGKPPSGILGTTVSAFGDYDQCLNIKVDDVQHPFVGKYCMLEFWPSLPEKPKVIYANHLPPVFNNMTMKTEVIKKMVSKTWGLYSLAFNWGLCLPSVCTKQDIEIMTNSLLEKLIMGGEVLKCETKETQKKLDITGWSIIIALLSVTALVLAFTLADMWLQVSQKATNQKGELGLLNRFTVALSLKNNCTKFFSSTENKDKDLNFLVGLRCFCTVWIVAGHITSQMDFLLARNAEFVVHDLIPGWYFQPIWNAHLAVYTFFFLTGLIISFNLVKSYDSKGPSVFNIPAMIVRRIFRIIPITMVVVGLMILTPYIGSGPMWENLVVSMADRCRKNWLPLLLSYNNFVPFSEMCLIHTWYLSADLQLFVIACVYFSIYFKKPKLGTLLAVVIAISSIIIAGTITYIKDFPPYALANMADKIALPYLFNNVNFPFYTNMGCYAIALLTGSFLARNRKIKISKGFQILGWCLSSAVSVFLIWSLLIWYYHLRKPTLAESVPYASLFKTGWSLSLAWLSVICVSGKGGFVELILSWRGYMLFNKLSFLIYLVHFPLIHYYYGSMRGSHDSSLQMLTWTFGGTLVTSIFVSFILKLLFEYPVSNVVDILLSRNTRTSKPKTNVPEINGHTENLDIEMGPKINSSSNETHQ